MLDAFDVLISGAGPAGLAAALTLVGRDFSVSVLDTAPANAPRIGEHLSPEAMESLDQLGIKDEVQRQRHIPCYQVESAWGESTLASDDYILRPYGHGLNLDRPAFDTFLSEEAKRRGAELRWLARLKCQTWTGTEWVVTIDEDGKTWTERARFLIDATGRSARIARPTGARRVIYDRLIGLVGYIDGEAWRSNHSLLVESRPNGWWYATKLPKDRCVAAFMIDADQFSARSNQLLPFWQRELRQTTHVRKRIGNSRPSATIHIRPAHSQRLDRVVGPGWLAVGDSAMSFDPLSSAGISKGLSWGIRAGQVVSEYLAGCDRCLFEYQRQVFAGFDEYLNAQRHYYRMENRWRSSPFWQRRQNSRVSEMSMTLDS